MTTELSNIIGLGFGTAGLGGNSFNSVIMALDAGFRKFDTAEADYWYDQEQVGEALEYYFTQNSKSATTTSTTTCQNKYNNNNNGNDDETNCQNICKMEHIEVSTKIPPWELTSIQNIRSRASMSRQLLLGFCDDTITTESSNIDYTTTITTKNQQKQHYPLDVYYIHAPKCWQGWHPKCNNVKRTLSLRQAWLGMEYVVSHDFNAKRIGLSNVSPDELLDIIYFVQERNNEQQEEGKEDDDGPKPRMPDVVQAYADPFNPSNQLRDICQKYGIEFVSYSTLGTQHVMKNEGNPVLTNSDILDLADKYGRSSAEVVLSWAMQKGMSVIPRSSKQDHIYELARLFEDGKFLDPSDVRLIDSLSWN